LWTWMGVSSVWRLTGSTKTLVGERRGGDKDVWYLSKSSCLKGH
jgi:hypothetical protein